VTATGSAFTPADLAAYHRARAGLLEAHPELATIDGLTALLHQRQYLPIGSADQLRDALGLLEGPAEVGDVHAPMLLVRGSIDGVPVTLAAAWEALDASDSRQRPAEWRTAALAGVGLTPVEVG
jgi:hypothetical protein